MDSTIILFGITVLLLGAWMYNVHILTTQIERERVEWKSERQMLLDRIQAPSFAEYTNKVIREKKAEQPEEEQPEVEFVS